MGLRPAKCYTRQLLLGLCLDRVAGRAVGWNDWWPPCVWPQYALGKRPHTCHPNGIVHRLQSPSNRTCNAWLHVGYVTYKWLVIYRSLIKLSLLFTLLNWCHQAICRWHFPIKFKIKRNYHIGMSVSSTVSRTDFWLGLDFFYDFLEFILISFARQRSLTNQCFTNSLSLHLFLYI